MARTTVTGLPSIGDCIRAWRIFRGLSSTELAEKAGVRSQYLSEIEHNRTANPWEEYVEKLAVALVVPLQDIYGRRMPLEDSKAGAPSSKQPEVRKRTKRSSVHSTRLKSPLSTSHQEILVQRLAVLEKILRNAHEEVIEIRALVAHMEEE